MARPYRYHTYDREGAIHVPTLDGTSTELRTVYSLKKDLEDLRKKAVGKGICDASVVDVGESHEKRKQWAIKLGNGSSHKVLFTGCHHAREWIAVEVPYYVAEYIVEKYTASPKTTQEKRLKFLMDNRQIWFVPLVNPDGHEFTTRMRRGWRPARRAYPYAKTSIVAQALGGGSRTISVAAGTYTGVDINRNYACSNWGQETFYLGSAMTSQDPADSGDNSVWCGPSAQSEIEGKNIADLINKHQFRASITYHNFSQLLLYPDMSASDAFVQFVGNGMDTLIREKGNPYTYEAGSTLYPTTGDAMEFAWEKVPGRPTFTPELRPKETDPADWYFSGLPENQIGPCFEENLAAALALINCAGHDKASSPIKGSTPGTSGTKKVKLKVVPNCWKVFSGWVP